MEATRHHLLRCLAMVVTCGLAMASVACSNSEAGTPVPRESGPTGAGSESDPSSTGNVPRSLAEVDPCELLSSSDRAQLDLGEGKNDDVAGARVCDWESEPGRFGLSVALHDDLGFKDANLRGATPIPFEVGKHEAYKVENPSDRRCGVFIVVTESSMAQLEGTALAARDAPKVCNVISQVAQIIDPKLP